MFKKKFLGLPLWILALGGIATYYFWDKIKPHFQPIIDKVKAVVSPTPAQVAQKEVIDFINNAD